MSDNKNVDNVPEKDQLDMSDTNIAAVASSEVSSIAGSVKSTKTHHRKSSSSERQIKFERAQKCLENAALVSKRIKEHRKATAELLGRPFEEDDGDTMSEMASTLSERTGYSGVTDTSTTLSVQDALNIPGISESLANTLKQKELLMERIKQYKEISKRPMMKSLATSRKESVGDSKLEIKKTIDNNDVTKLQNAIKEKENALSVIQVKMKAMETTILDLQEKINEKNQIIEAKNKATALMSDSLSKKDKDSLVLLEDTRQQMSKMQENFIIMETEWKEEKQRLLNEIEAKDSIISNMKEANTILENSRFEISVAHSKLAEELDLKNKMILELNERIEKLSHIHVQEPLLKEKDDVEEEKGSIEISSMVELTKKIELLEQINLQIRQTNKELEDKLAKMASEPKSPLDSSPSKKTSPLSTRKGGRNTASKMKSPWSNLSSESLPQETEKKINKNEIAKFEMLVQSLNKDILQKEYIISQKDSLISELQAINVQREATISELQLNIQKQNIDVVDIGITTECTEDSHTIQSTTGEVSNEYCSTNIKDLQEKLQAAQDHIGLLNNEIDAANKNMIKVKSSHKLKLKQMQKTIDNFSKISDANAEIIKLNEELHHLSQKVAELEEEKGNLQLHLVDYDSGRLTESDVYKKMVEMENLAEARLKAISVLEAQKFDLVQELHVIQQKNVEMEDKLADMSQLQNEQVCSEMSSVQLEEQVDNLVASKKELELIIDNLKLDKEQLNGNIKLLEEEKEVLNHKLQQYIQENIELTDKLEKLSAEKVSSAESIEIVESLTTQEKLELEEYNKGMIENKIEDPSESYRVPISHDCNESIEKLVEESAELNKKIELFTRERQEVMEKMNNINGENEALQEKILKLSNEHDILQNTIDILQKEKHEMNTLNEKLNHQLEELKQERFEIVKDSIDSSKPVSLEEGTEALNAEIQHDDKSVGDKGINRNKSVKQLTKEILKLKNTIKEREAEIADCQMRILSLEEQQQKQNECIQSNAAYESKIKHLMDENSHLKEELNILKKDMKFEEQLLQFKQTNESLQKELQTTQQEYSTMINIRDSKITELENLLLEYEKQIVNYANSLQQKDKEMTEYINQITKLNDVSQKLKSTIELLEEEKTKDQNIELVKSLNKQISIYQKKLNECDEKMRNLEEDKVQLLTLKSALENKNASFDADIKKLQESLLEKQDFIKELQAQQLKHSEEMASVILQAKERDEEIHEIKLQLRKESIENEKLRSCLTEKDKNTENFAREYEETKQKLYKLSLEKDKLNDQYLLIENKNKELMDKLKKFAINIKKKTAMYSELENQLHELQKQLEVKHVNLEQLSIQVETLPVLQDKLKYAEEELNRLQSLKVKLEQQKSHDLTQLKMENKSLEDKLVSAANEISKLNDSLSALHKELHFTHEENANLKTQIDTLNNRLVEHEIEQKNNSNYVTKIVSLEADMCQKQTHIEELLCKLENQEQQLSQLQFGHEAKLQERDLYIENLESEINKYKNRIYRLEDSISVMEDRRYSLERKADQLGSQLQEKQKAYTEYTSQEDELVSRLAVLMDHDRVVEKQLHEIESENKDLRNKIQHLTNENQRLHKCISDIQDHCNTLVERASKADSIESELVKNQTQLRELELYVKRITQEHQTLLAQKKQDIEELESEFNTQIESAIKEKKVLSEKYEKISEHVLQLEHKLQEYQANIQNLNMNIEELNRINQELTNKSINKEVQSPDYTEQYVTEINKLNAVINSKDQDINTLNNKIQMIEANNFATVSNLESKITELTTKLQLSADKIEELVKENNLMKENHEKLQILLLDKEDQFKQLMEKKKVSFEMNIPKTEGMIISSTIEALNEDSQGVISSLESQIVPDVAPSYSDSKSDEIKVSEGKKSIDKDVSSKEILEPIIVPKKAYLCYKEEGNVEETDPFNSDEGWGLGENEESEDATPGLSYLNDQIHQLKKENQIFKQEIETSNNKLLRALKKLKELKSHNDSLTNELKISKQIPQSSILDTAIEDELRNNIQKLEKEIEELNAQLNKEKRDNDTLKKQKEILNNANDKLIDMKEKMENEIELWKYKFKEVNDKMSSLQWGSDSKDSPGHTVSSAVLNIDDTLIKDEIVKLEKENDELQLVIDQLNSQIKEQKDEINSLNKQLQQRNSVCVNCESLKSQILEIQSIKTELLKQNEVLNEKLLDIEVRYNDLEKQLDHLKANNEEICRVLENKNKELIERNSKLEQEIQSYRISETDYKTRIIELESVKSKSLWSDEQQITNKLESVNTIALTEKYSNLEDNCTRLKQNLVEANYKILQLENENKELLHKSKESNDQINELNSKIHNLNNENDQLLSTVAELRSSISTAVDQRGFEIAELWKQHLAQREADFQKTEHDLRTQLSASEAKYDQLLDSVQSSSQEETNKLVILEQVTSLHNKLRDKEEHLHNLQDKYAEVLNQLDMMRSEMEDEKLMHENKLLSQEEEYEKKVQELTERIHHISEDYEQNTKNLQNELTKTKMNTEELNGQIEALQKIIKESEAKILDVSNQLRIKDSEIYQKTHDYTITLTQRNEEFENVRKQLIEYEKKVEDLTYEKESELAVFRLKMHESGEHYEKMHKEFESEKTNLTEALNAKIIECTNLNKQIADLNQILEEHSVKATEMQTALENQELEIVTLKDEISSLQDMIQSSSSKIEKHVTFASDTKLSTDEEKSNSSLNKELLDAVPRAELDLALYMLHQRDVRCEELTMELTQLLEERDTLQLRLSDSLRLHEELKSRCKSAGMDVSMTTSQETISDVTGTAVEKEQQFVDTHRGQTSRSSSLSDPDGEKLKLQAKLSELRSVRHSRDVRLRHESEQRQLGMRLLQRDVAHLPPEAVDQLAQAHHTLSRDSQSTSTVLLNWLRGKGTPKVVHNM